MRWRLGVAIALVLLVVHPVLSDEQNSVDYEVINDYYADPFTIDISSMPSFDSLSEEGWNKVVLPDPCKTGSGNQSFIIVKKGSGVNASKLLIYLEGGGACLDYNSCTPSVGTIGKLDLDFNQLVAYYQQGIFNFNNNQNPFRDWTILFVPYTTGDIHLGNRVVKYYNPSNPEQNKTIYHIGYVNAIVAMRWINSSGNFDTVVVTGSSAGGFGTILHFYRASEIFNKGVIAINDAGPGTSANVTSPFQLSTIDERWGAFQNFPQESLPYFENSDPIKFLNWALNASSGGCGDCVYALFEDQWDLVIGYMFQGYNFPDFQTKLLSAIADIKENFSDRFCSYLPLSTYHTSLAGGYNRFYNLHIDGYTLVQWVNDVLNRNCVDMTDEGQRDLQVEIVSAPSSASVGKDYNITVKVKNVGNNATPDPFFVVLSSGGTTLDYTVTSLSANANVTLNLTWTPTTVGTNQLNVTVDELMVPDLAALLPFGSVVELLNYPFSEANNTAAVSVSVISPWQSYDSNGNGHIEDTELIQAIMDWLNGNLSDMDLLNVIMKWLAG